MQLRLQSLPMNDQRSLSELPTMSSGPLEIRQKGTDMNNILIRREGWQRSENIWPIGPSLHILRHVVYTSCDYILSGALPQCAQPGNKF